MATDDYSDTQADTKPNIAGVAPIQFCRMCGAHHDWHYGACTGEPVQATEPTNPWPKGCPEHEARERSNAERCKTTNMTPFEPDTGMAAFEKGWDDALAWAGDVIQARIDQHHANGRLAEASECVDLLAAIDGGPTDG